MSNIPKAKDITHFGTALLAKDSVWKLWLAIVTKLYPDSKEVVPVPFSELSDEAAEEDLWQLCVDFIEKNISTPIVKNNG